MIGSDSAKVALIQGGMLVVRPEDLHPERHQQHEVEQHHQPGRVPEQLGDDQQVTRITGLSETWPMPSQEDP
jgi:hypothetical protein